MGSFKPDFEFEMLIVDRVDLVDLGANDDSFIRVFKGRNVKELTFEEVLKSLPEDQRKLVETKLTDVTKSKDTAEESLAKEVEKAKTAEKEAKEAKEALAKSKEELEKAKKSAAEPSDEPSEEEVLKSMPEFMRERFISQKKQLELAEEMTRQSMEREAELKAVQKAKDLKALPLTDDELTTIAKSVDDDTFNILSALAKNIGESDAFTDIGKSRGPKADSTGDFSIIEKRATEIATAKGISHAHAIREVVENNPELYKQYLGGLK